MRVLELPVEYLDLAAATRYPKPKKRFFPGGDWDGRGQIGLVGPGKKANTEIAATHRRWIPMTSWI